MARAHLAMNVRVRAEAMGLKVETASPGDGRRRYEFTNARGHIVGRALGAQDAAQFLSGFRAGQDELLLSQRDLLLGATNYLDHPDVRALKFALPSQCVALRLRALAGR